MDENGENEDVLPKLDFFFFYIKLSFVHSIIVDPFLYRFVFYMYLLSKRFNSLIMNFKKKKV